MHHKGEAIKYVYLAARYSRREELCQYRQVLDKADMYVTSRWLNGDHQVTDEGVPIRDSGERLIESDESGFEASTLRARFAKEDLNDVDAADALIFFSEPPRSKASRGGRHVEFGYALALDKKVILIGKPENIFHWDPFIEQYDTWADFCTAWAIPNG